MRGSSLLLVSFLIACGADPERDPRSITELTAELEPVVHGNNAFAWKLYREAAKTEGNLFLSPFSAYAALVIAYSGAAGDSAAEMRTALSIEGDDESFHRSFGALIDDLAGDHGRGYRLGIANGVFGHSGAAFVPTFLDRAKGIYGARVESLDFARPEQARAHINAWVRKKTEGLLRSVVPEGAINQDTRVVLANAMYFSAPWTKKFNRESTRPRPFRTTAGETVEVDTMSEDFRKWGQPGPDHLLCAYTDSITLAELTFEDEETSMVFLLPDRDVPLSSLEERLDGDYVDALLEPLQPCEILVELPRFDFTSQLSLVPALRAMGIEQAFDRQRADLSNLVEDEPLFLGEALHQATVHVDEEGMVAAASTQLFAYLVSVPTAFIADRDFVFLVRDRLTGAILFTGRVSDPRPVESTE
jgi:serpin B